MVTKIIVVKAAYDAESSVWIVESSDLPGLNAEAETIETLLKELPAVIGDLLAEGGFGDEEGAGREVPIELIAHASTKASVAA